MSVGVIGDRCDSRNVISVGQCCVGSVGVIEHDGFFIVSFIRELGGRTVLLCWDQSVWGCYERSDFFVGWICAGDGVMFTLVEDLG